MRLAKPISVMMEMLYEEMITRQMNAPDVHEQYVDWLLALYDQAGPSVVDDAADDVEPKGAYHGF